MAPQPFPKLNESNYDDWKVQMEALLEEQGLFGVVDGRDTAPAAGPNSKAGKAFTTKCRQARAKIILGLEPSQFPHVRLEEDPAVIWEKLTQIHRARGLGVLLTMRMDFLKMTMLPDSSIASFVAKIRHAAYRLQECYDAEQQSSLSSSTLSSLPVVTDLDLMTVLLNGLPQIYQPVIVDITGTPLSQLTFETVVTRLLNEEGRLRHNSFLPDSESPIAEAMAVTYSSRKAKSRATTPKDPAKLTCHKCGGVGHVRAVCPSKDADTANFVDVEDDLALAIDYDSDGVY